MPKYLIRNPRYLNGVYVRASPEAPTVIEVPEGHKVDRGMEPLEGAPAHTPLKPHHAGPGAVHPMSAPEKSDKPAEKSKDTKGKRAADTEQL